MKLYVSLCAVLFFGLNAADYSEVFIYCHGSNSAKLQRYQEAGVLPNDTIPFNFQDGRINAEPVHGIGMGPEDYVRRFNQIVGAQSRPVILFGESRNAATIVRYVGNSFCPIDKIKAVVADSSFDTEQNMIKHRMRGWYIDRIMAVSTAESILERLTNYRRDELQPIDATKSIANKDAGLPLQRKIPMLFIASKEDKVVPPASSVNMYRVLRENGHDEAYIHLLNHGAHGWGMEGADAASYKEVVHGFYRNTGIRHNPEYSRRGIELLRRNCQPDLSSVDVLLKEME